MIRYTELVNVPLNYVLLQKHVTYLVTLVLNKIEHIHFMRRDLEFLTHRLIGQQ